MDKPKKSPLLLQRKIHVPGTSPYDPAKHLKDNFKSVTKVQYVYTFDSSGHWTGYLIQRIGTRHYLITFSQQKEDGAFTVSTAKEYFAKATTPDTLEKEYLEHYRQLNS